MNYKKLILFTICLFSLLYGQTIQSQKGYLQYENDADSILQDHFEYDKNGNLTLESHPMFYCDMKYTYDSKNRLIERDFMCGESSANGITTVSYNGDSTLEFEDTYTYLRNSYSIENKKLKSKFEYSITNYHEDNRKFVREYLNYWSNKLNIIDFKEIEYIENDSIKTMYRTVNQYNDKDSLILNYKINLIKKDTIEKTVYEYNAKNQLIKVSNFYSNKLTNEIIYEYNSDSKLTKEIRHEFDNKNIKYKSRESFYQYSGNLLTIKHLDFDNKEKNTYTVEEFFEKDLIMKRKSYSDKGILIETTRFYYTYW